MGEPISKSPPQRLLADGSSTYSAATKARESKRGRTMGNLTWASPTPIVRGLSPLDIVSCTLRRTTC